MASSKFTQIVTERLGLPPFALSREHVYLVAAVILQVLFWYLCSPGPQLASGYQANWNDAVRACLLTSVLFLIIPLVIIWWSGDSPGRIGLAVGEWRTGITALVVLIPVMVGATVLGSGDAGLRAFYPMPGKDIANSSAQLFGWFGIYSIYYVSFEFFYRGFLFRGPEKLGLFTCFALQAACSVLIHVGKPMTETFASLPAAFVFGWLAYRTKSIWYVFVLHFLIGISNDLASLWHSGRL